MGRKGGRGALQSVGGCFFWGGGVSHMGGWLVSLDVYVVALAVNPNGRLQPLRTEDPPGPQPPLPDPPVWRLWCCCRQPADFRQGLTPVWLRRPLRGRTVERRKKSTSIDSQIHLVSMLSVPHTHTHTPRLGPGPTAGCFFRPTSACNQGAFRTNFSRSDGAISTATLAAAFERIVPAAKKHVFAV